MSIESKSGMWSIFLNGILVLCVIIILLYVYIKRIINFIITNGFTKGCLFRFIRTFFNSDEPHSVNMVKDFPDCKVLILPCKFVMGNYNYAIIC
eukprot:UN28581